MTGCGSAAPMSGEPSAPAEESGTVVAALGARLAVIGWHDALEDPAAPGLMRAELTADGDHPSVEGYRVLGELVAKALAARPKP
jgi:lysophospholipase L1-like esterase